MGVFLRHSTYWMSYTANGIRHRESCNTSNKREAEQRLASRITAVTEGRFFDIKKTTPVLFKDFVNRYIAEHSKINKKSWEHDLFRLRDLMVSFGGRYLHEITVADIAKFKAQQMQTKALRLGRPICTATINRKLALLKAILNKAVDWEVLEDNPCRKIKLFRENNTRDRFLSREEFNRLLTECKGELLQLVTIAVHTGLRKGEIMGLKWNDIDVTRKLIYVRRSGKFAYSTKSSKNRVVPMNDVVCNTFLSILKHPDSDYIFDNTHRNAFKTALKRSKIEDFRFHDLRHTFASYLAMASVPINTIKDLLGHSTINITMRYSHVTPEHKAASVEKLGTILTQSKISADLMNMSDYATLEEQIS